MMAKEIPVTKVTKAMKRFGVAVAVVTMTAGATNAFAQTDGKMHGLFQVGVTTGAETASDPQRPKLALGADFGQAISRYVEIYVAGGWQEEVPPGLRDTTHLTSGVKLMFLGDTTVRPYVLAGAGLMHFRWKMPIDAIEAPSKNKFLGVVGGGVAFAVGSHGYIDVGYRYFMPYNTADIAPDFTPNGVFAGFGFQY